MREMQTETASRAMPSSLGFESGPQHFGEQYQIRNCIAVAIAPSAF
jgi:hypothetical protein